MTEPRLSLHPIDVLIRRITGGSKRTSESDAQQIVERMATGPLLTRSVSLPAALRSLLPQEQDVSEPVPSLTLHLLTRVFVDGQWAVGTKPADYLTDVRTAVRHERSRLGVYTRRSGSMAATISETELIVPEARRGERWLPYMLVVYSADRGMIVTSYQFSNPAAIALSEDVQWLR